VAVGLERLTANSNISLDFQANLLANAPGLVNNTAIADFHDGSAPAESISNTSTVNVVSEVMGVSKAASIPVANVDANGVADGTATVRFVFLARNFGAGTLYNVGIRDRLENMTDGLAQYTAAAVPGVGQYTVVANSVRMVSLTGAGAVAAVATDFTGQAAHAELLARGAILSSGGSLVVQMDVRFNLTGLADTLYNSATAHAANEALGNDTVNAQSVNGLDPDANHDGIPDEPSRTPYSTKLPVLNLLKTVSPARPVSGATGTYDVDISLKVTNVSLVEAPSVRLADNLFCSFEMDKKDANGNSTGPVASWQIMTPPRSLNGLLTPFAGYTGGAFCDRISQGNTDDMASFPFDPSLTLVEGTRALASGQSDTIRLTVRVTLKPDAVGRLTTVKNRAWAGIVQPLAGTPSQYNNGKLALVWATSSTADVTMSDPSGVVYNAITRQPVAGAVVTLTRLSCPASAVGPIKAAELFGDTSIYTFNADGSAAMVTDANGVYAFVFKAPPVNDLCTYSLKVTPPAGSGLAFPSKLIAPHDGLFNTCGAVTPVAGVPQGGADVSYYSQIKAGADHSTGVVCEVFNNNIPLDPSVGSGVTLQKTASATTAEVGDLLTFTLRATNQTNLALPQLAIKDQLPVGFRFVPGSARVDGTRVADPTGGIGPTLVFNMPLSGGTPLAIGQSMALTYQVRIGANTPIGVDAVNRAWASSGVAPSALTSNEADARVRVTGGVFATEAYAFGKVFMDCNKNGIQDDAELGIPGVRLFLEDGTGVVTDIEGKWSIYGLRPVTHALRLDTTTLPEGAELALIEPRQSGQADSVFLDLKNGEWHKANFAVQNCEAPDLLKAVHARRDAIITQPGAEGEANRAVTRLTPDGKVVAPSDVRGLPSAGTIDTSGTLKGIGAVSSPLITVPGSISNSDFGTPVAGIPSPFPPSVPASVANPVTTGNEGLPGASSLRTEADMTPMEDTLVNQDRKLGFLNLKNLQVLSSAVFNVRVKGTLGSRLVLSVNGEVVDEKRIGKRAQLESQQLEAWEYIAVKFRPGINTLKVEEVDGFGISRGTVAIEVNVPGALARIEIETVQTARADERTLVPVKIRLVDAQGLPVTERTSLTLESIAARWTTTDLNSLEPGVQVMVEGGSASFDLAPPANPGDGKIRISAGAVQSETRIIFLPDLRPLTGIGVLEGVLNLRNPGNMPLGAARTADAFESELRGYSETNGNTTASARTAFYFKGAVKGDYLLTLAYDTDKTTATTMFRDIQPDQFYPIYGDSSVKTFDAQSSQRLYVRIDKNRSYLLYGDFNTASSPEVRRLSQVSRTATGLQHVINGDDLRITSHFSQDSLKQVLEEFPANGTSGPFNLAKSNGSDLFGNSETVQIIVRDRNQPNVVLSTTPLTRFSDYTIEPLSKTILFTRPISSLDSDLNPQSIRVNYLVDTGGPVFDVAGTDIQLRVSDRLQLGAVVEYEGTPDNIRKLAAATALAKLDEKTLLSAEIVGTHSELKGDGTGLGVELRHDDALLKYNLHVQLTDNRFDNPSAAVLAGHAEARGHLEYQINPETKLKGDLVYSQDNNLTGGNDVTSSIQTQGLGVAVQRSINPNVVAEVGFRAGQTDTTAATNFDYGSVSAGSPSVTTTASGVTKDTFAVRARVTAKVPDVPNAQVFVEGDQDVNDPSRHLVALGGNYAINDKARVYGRYELISSLGNEYALTSGVQRNVGLVGVESAYMKGGRIYDEYRIADTIDGRAMQSAMGVRNTFEVTDSLRLTGGLEQVSALPGANGTATGESKAITGAFDWLGTNEYKNRLRGSGSIELRDGVDATSDLLTVGLAYKLDADWSLLTRAAVNRVSSHTNGSLHWLEREQIGFAYRPVDQDVWNALMRYEHKVDNWDGVASSDVAPVNTLTDIISVHLNYQPTPRDLMSARWAAKQNVTTSDAIRSTYSAQLLYGRWTHDISQDWDFGVQAGLLMGDGNMQQQTLGLELGYQLSQGLWLSAGYNFLGLHDPDLAGADYTDSGAYLRLRFKFDERLFSGSSSSAADAKQQR
jgi:uncharacterized repeat protein (TIGR01451 family)